MSQHCMAMIPGGAGLLQTLIVAFKEARILGFPDADQMEQLYGLANRGGQRRLGHGLSQSDTADDCFKGGSRERISIEMCCAFEPDWWCPSRATTFLRQISRAVVLHEC